MKQEKLSYARLVSRTDFYKQKALDLEQQVVFGEEMIKELENEMKQLRLNSTQQVKEQQKHFEQLKSEYEKLQEENRNRNAEGTAEEIKQLREQLQEKKQTINQLNEMAEDPNHKVSQADQERIEKFEQLLSDVQTELNEKESQLDSYKNRIKSLEKRLSAQQAIPSYSVFSETGNEAKTGRKVIAYFDYSIVLEREKESIIRGHFHIENISGQSLGTPFVCFRFYPLDAAALKGKIISLEQAERRGDSNNLRWIYMDDDWGNSAKERGEIWVRPYQNIALKSNQTVTLADFQIPVKKHYDDKVMVEGFVYFQNSGYKEKAANQILMTF